MTPSLPFNSHLPTTRYSSSHSDSFGTQVESQMEFVMEYFASFGTTCIPNMGIHRMVIGDLAKRYQIFSKSRQIKDMCGQKGWILFFGVISQHEISVAWNCFTMSHADSFCQPPKSDRWLRFAILVIVGGYNFRILINPNPYCWWCQLCWIPICYFWMCKLGTGLGENPSTHGQSLGDPRSQPLQAQYDLQKQAGWFLEAVCPQTAFRRRQVNDHGGNVAPWWYSLDATM